MLVIPPAPARLVLPIEKHWHGARSDGPRGRLELALRAGDLWLRAELRRPGPAAVPAAPPGTRVDGLWNYDVVECFLAGSAGRYLEVEIGAAGHFLLLGFRARRVREASWPGLRLATAHGRSPDGAWWASLSVPRALLPLDVRAVNAFAIAAGELLAHAPLPGAHADFHQPERWPAARLGRR